MKVGTTGLLKFRKLARRLGESTRGVVGLLELLWMVTGQQCPRGDIGRFSDEDIAELLDWSGDPELLVQALLSTGWLDPHSEARLIVHDWPDHAPGYIHALLTRRGEGFFRRESADGTGDMSGDASGVATGDGTGDASAERSPRARAITNSIQFNSIQFNSLDPLPPDSGEPGESPPTGVDDRVEKKNLSDSSKAKKPKQERFIPDGICQGPEWSDAFRDVWLRWCQHRRDIRKPLTRTSCEELIAQFRDWGESRSIEAMRYTIRRGWKGLQEPPAYRARDDDPDGYKSVQRQCDAFVAKIEAKEREQKRLEEEAAELKRLQAEEDNLGRERTRGVAGAAQSVGFALRKVD